MRLFGDEIVTAPEPTSPGISLYPNPTSGAFTLDLSALNLTGEVRAEGYNLLGQRIYETTLPAANPAEIRLVDSPGGPYIIRVHNAGKVFSQKLVLQQ